MFTFNRGIWEDGSPLPEWQDDEDQIAYLDRVGYGYPRTVFGQEDCGHIEIYEARKGGSFYASVCPSGDVCHEVYLPDFPSFMLFIRDYGTVFATEATNITQQQTFDLLEKMFRVQHGHSSNTICEQCDPDAIADLKHRMSRQSGAA